MKDYNFDPFEENPSLDSRVEEGIIHVVPDAATTKEQQQEHISIFNQLQEENENPQVINADYNRSTIGRKPNDMFKWKKVVSENSLWCWVCNWVVLYP